MREVVITNHKEFHAELCHFVETANAAQKQILFRRTRLDEAQATAFTSDPLDATVACRRALALRQALGLVAGSLFVAIVDGNVQDAEDDEYFVIGTSDLPEFQHGASVKIVSLYFLDPRSAFVKNGGNWWQSLSALRRRRIAADALFLCLLCAVIDEIGGVTYHNQLRGCVMDYCQTPTDIVAALRGGFSFCETCRPTLQRTEDGRAVLAVAEFLSLTPFRFHSIGANEFDVFLCHRSTDKPAVRAISERLKQRGLRPWLDSEQLRPGFPWQRALEEQITRIKSVAVVVGQSDVGPWQELEIEAFLRQFVRRACPVIPVILPAAAGTLTLPAFLEGMQWVDFRVADPDPLEQLIWGITGEAPAASGI